MDDPSSKGLSVRVIRLLDKGRTGFDRGEAVSFLWMQGAGRRSISPSRVR
jgi:hypothetical protein